MKPLSAIGCDYAIMDLVTLRENFPEFEPIWNQLELKAGGKIGVDLATAAQLDAVFRNATAKLGEGAIKHYPGGSSANLMTTLQRLMPPKELQTHFLGVIGDDVYGKEIAAEFKNAGVQLVPLDYSGHVPQTTISYVINPPEGNRSLATYPGNAKEILVPAIFHDGIVRDHDILIVQGSMWEKFGMEFANKFTESRYHNPAYHDGEGGKNQEMWLALPTHATFGIRHAEMFQFIIPSSNVIVGNEVELQNISSCFDSGMPPLERIQQAFRQEMLRNDHKPQRRPQVALITCGEEGAVVITKDAMENIPSFRVADEEIQTTLGAGDTAAAYFLAAHLKADEQGKPLFTEKECGIISMAGAIGNLLSPGPRIDDPRAMLMHVLSDPARYPEGILYDETFVNRVNAAFFPERNKAVNPDSGRRGFGRTLDIRSSLLEGGYASMLRQGAERPSRLIE